MNAIAFARSFPSPFNIIDVIFRWEGRRESRYEPWVDPRKIISNHIFVTQLYTKHSEQTLVSHILRL